MKKTLTILAAALFAVSSQGATISWSLTGIAFDGNTLKDAGTEFSASLFYLGSGGTLASSYDQAAIDNLTIVETATGTTGKGANTGSYALTVGSDSDGDVFGMLLSYTSGGKTYYNIASTTYTLSGFVDATSTPAKYNIAAASMSYGAKEDAGSKVTPGGGWTTVPEPSTAALALAGLALLLKRRKA